MADIIDFQSRKIAPDTDAPEWPVWSFTTKDLEDGAVRISLTVPRAKEGEMFRALCAILELEV